MNADQRQGNLSEEQVALMSTFVSENRDALFGKAGHCSQRVLKRKEETWQRLLTSLEAQGLPKGRTWKDIRCAWNSWTSKAKKYRLRRTVTGGGPAPRYNAKYEAVLAAQAPQALDGFVGLEGETFIEADLPMTGSQNAEASAMLLDMVEQEVLDVEEPHAEPHAEPQAQPHAEPQVQTQAQPHAQPQAQPHAQPQAQPQAQPHAEPQAQPQAEPHAEPHSSRSANTPNSTGLEESYQERFLKLEQRKVEVLEKILTALTDIAHKLP